MRATITFLVALVLSMASGTIGATELAKKPDGMVILTVSGDVPHPNRGPAEPGFLDYFGKFGLSFEKAVEFDLDDLKALDQKEIKGLVEPGSLEGTFSGPLLADVLAAAGLPVSDLRGFGLDGYSAEITADAIEKYGPIVALYANGKLMGIGGFGPTSIVFPTSEDDAVNAITKRMQPWAAYYLEAK